MSAAPRTRLGSGWNRLVSRAALPSGWGPTIGARGPQRSAGGPAAGDRPADREPRRRAGQVAHRPGPVAALAVVALAGALVAGCGSAGHDDAPAAGGAGSGAPRSGPATSAPAPTPSTGGTGRFGAAPKASPSQTRAASGGTLHAGNPDGKASVPARGRPVDTSRPDRVIGDGTAASCTSAAVVAAVAAGGVITFSCGPDPLTITLAKTAKVKNANGPKIVLDGGGKITLSGGGKHRILYQNTCDEAQGWTTSHCNDQRDPQLTVQNLTFADGNSTGEQTDGGGGGAIFVRGGQLTVINSRFVRNRCDTTGPDLGGAAIRVLDQYQDQPVYIVGSTFGGASGQGGSCSNGGALSSIGVSWVVLNSLFSYNEAIGNGANPARDGTPGGGSGGAIYCDGNTFTVRIAGTIIERNHAKEGGGAIFFVSNDRTGTMRIEDSTLRRNPSDGFETAGLPGIFFLGASKPTTTGSSLS